MENLKSDNDFFKVLISMEMSDMNFKAYEQYSANVSFLIITVQLVVAVVGMLLSCFDIKVGLVPAIINLILLTIVMLNNYMGTRARRIAKKREYAISDMIDVLADTELPSADRQLHIAKLRGLNIKHPDEDLQRLVNKWYSYKDKKLKTTGYKDKNGKEYCVGSIAFNPFFGDMWLVEELTEEQMKMLDVDNKYVFSLYGNLDEYVMSIDEPDGFAILSNPDDVSYNSYILTFNKMYNTNKKELEEIEREETADNKEGENQDG